MEEGANLEKLGVELGLPKIAVEALGYSKDRMDVLLENAPELFEQYAMRDCEVALAWLLNCAYTQREVLHMDRLAPTTGSASASGLKKDLEEHISESGEGFADRFATSFSNTRQEWVPTPRRAENESYVIQAFA